MGGASKSLVYIQLNSFEMGMKADLPASKPAVKKRDAKLQEKQNSSI